jgi:hypothetical protein
MKMIAQSALPPEGERSKLSRHMRQGKKNLFRLKRTMVEEAIVEITYMNE